MKTLILLVAIAAAGWLLMAGLRRNAAVKQAQQAPVSYVKSLQDDAARAKAAAAAANAAVKAQDAEVRRAADAP